MTGQLVYNELQGIWKESNSLVYFRNLRAWSILETIIALAFASKHYRKSHKSPAEIIRVPGASGMLHQMVFLGKIITV
jgi:hypothetical protein